MLVTSYIKTQRVKFMVRLILLITTCCFKELIHFILQCTKQYQYVTGNRNSLLHQAATKSSSAIKLLTDVITLIICFNGMLLVIFTL